MENYRISQAEELKRRRQEKLDKRTSFRVFVEPTLRKAYDVKADNLKEACDKARRMYDSSNISVPDGFEITRIDVVTDGGSSVNAEEKQTTPACIQNDAKSKRIENSNFRKNLSSAQIDAVKYMDKKGCSKAKVAAILGCSAQTVGRIVCM